MGRELQPCDRGLMYEGALCLAEQWSALEAEDPSDD
jgi:hypothetical protein